MVVIGPYLPLKPIILQEDHQETIKSSNHLDRLPRTILKKIRYDPIKSSLSHFAKSSVGGRSVRLRLMKSYLS